MRFTRRLAQARAAAMSVTEALDSLRATSEGTLEERILRAGLVASLAAASIQTLCHVADVALFERRFVLLDADHDQSAFAWASVSATAAAALAAALLAAVRARWRFVVLAALLAFLSLDDLIQIHERIGELDDALGLPHALQFRRLVWVIVFLPLLAAVAVLLWRTAAEAPPRTGSVVRGGVIVLAAAVALEAATPVLFQFNWGQDSIPYETEVVLEEGAELLGWIWIASGLAAYAYTAAAHLRGTGSPP